MSRLIASILGTTLAIAPNTAVWSQQVQSGQGGTAAAASGNQATGANTTAGATGQANPDASGAARAGMPGQSGTVSDFGPAAPQQGQFFPSGQPAMGPTAGVGQFTRSGQFIPGGQSASQFSGGQFNAAGQLNTGGQQITGNQFTTGGAATSRFNQVFGSRFGGVATGVFTSPTPWFSSPGIRAQLQLDARQYQQLYNAYVDANTRYNQAAAQLPANLLAAERAGRIQALQERYIADFNRILDATLTRPELRRQFNQLSAQYESSAPASAQDTRQAPSLTPEQHRRLNLMASQWNRLADQLRGRAAAGESVPKEDIEELNREAQKQIESTLTPEQQANWPQLVGQYYDMDGRASPSQSQTPSSPPVSSVE